MKRNLKMVLIFCMGLLTTPVQAGKLEDIVSSVKAECGKEITKEEAVRAVKAVFVTCAPGAMVELEGGCRLKCMKRSGGGVLGE